MSHHESFEKHEHAGTNHTCKVCSSSYSHHENPSSMGICTGCGYKILIVLFIVMIVSSYMAWFGVF
jgi:hypothetical protein